MPTISRNTYERLPQSIRDLPTGQEVIDAAKGLTRGPLKTSDVYQWILDSDLAYIGSDDAWKGALRTVADDPGTYTPTLSQGVDKFLGHIKSKAEHVDTHQTKYSLEIWHALQGLKAATIIDDAQIDTFYTIDGGLILGTDCVAQDVDDVRAMITSEDADASAAQTLQADYETAWSTHISPFVAIPNSGLTGTTNRAGLVAGMRAAADEIEGV